MRKPLLPLITLLALLFSASAAQAQWSESKLQDLYQDYLKGRGIESRIDSDGDIQFDYEDSLYFIEVNEDDPEFFRVVMPNIWPIESEKERIQVIKACDIVNRNMKCTKANTVSDDVWVSVELFVGRPDSFKEVFDRCIAAIDSGIATFVEEMQ